MNRIIIVAKSLILVGLLCCETARGGPGHSHEKPVPATAPSHEPDRIFLTFHGDPATARGVNWRTNTKIRKAQAQIAKATGDPAFRDSAITLDATTEQVDLSGPRGNGALHANYHSVTFEGLTPDTLYAYRVGSGRAWSEWIQFKTAQKEDKPFRFVYFGDAQNEIHSMWSRVIRMSYEKAPDAAFAIYAGDLVSSAHRDVEWAEWFDAGGWIHQQRTGIPVAGNHEYAGVGAGSLSLQWRPQFNLPVEADLPEQLHESVYTVDYQGVRIIVLNSVRFTGEQAPYLEKQLSRPGARWTVLTSHYSFFSPRGDGRVRPSKLAWMPIIEKHGVDLVLQGHDHAYVRGHTPVAEVSTGAGGKLGAVYVTSISGPRHYPVTTDMNLAYADQNYTADKIVKQIQFFHVIEVDGNELRYKSYDAAGKVHDAFTIVKDLETGEKAFAKGAVAEDH